jgi:hypothetical protein
VTTAARRAALTAAAGHCTQCRRPFGAVLSTGAAGEWQDGGEWRDWRGRPCAAPREQWGRACDACVLADGRVLCRACCSREGGRPRRLGPKQPRARRVAGEQLVMRW